MIQSERTILAATDDVWMRIFGIYQFWPEGTARTRSDLQWDSVSPEEYLSPSIHSHSWSSFLGSLSCCMAFDQVKILFFYVQLSRLDIPGLTEDSLRKEEL